MTFAAHSTVPSSIGAALADWLQRRGGTTAEWSLHEETGSGFSQAHIWRLVPQSTFARSRLDCGGDNSPSPGFAVRCWGRSGRWRQHLEAILFFQQAAHVGLRDNSLLIDFVPLQDSLPSSLVPQLHEWTAGELCLEVDNTYWTVEDWLPGKPLAHGAAISESLLKHASKVIPRLHSVASQLGVHSMIAPGVIERRQFLDRILPKAKDAAWKKQLINQNVSLRSPFQWSQIVEHAFDYLLRHRDRFRRDLGRWLVRPVECHWIVRDLWRDNILVDDDRVSGIVDFGAARIDWPGLDWIRWGSSWFAPDDERFARCLEENRCLSFSEYRFFDSLGTLLSLWQWFFWLSDGTFSVSHLTSRGSDRIVELHHRLANWEE